MTYQQQQAQKTVDRLTAAGWTFKVHSYTPEMKGWWVAPDAKEYKYRGDPKGFYTGAQLAEQVYLKN